MSKSKNTKTVTTSTKIKKTAPAKALIETSAVAKRIAKDEAKGPKQTPLADRLFHLTDDVLELPEKMVFKSKQRQIVYNVLLDSTVALTVGYIAQIATKAGLTAKGGVEASVAFHLHHMVKDAVVVVRNPTISE